MDKFNHSHEVSITGDFNAADILYVDNVETAVGINQPQPDVTLDISGSDAIKVPVGTDAERPIGVEGYIRYNSTSDSFEGYAAGNWSSLGGVKDVDQDTFIQAESTPGADEDVLSFFNAGTLTTSLTADGFTVIDVDDINIDSNIISISAVDTSLQLEANGAGEVFVNDDTRISGTARIQDSATLDTNLTVNDTQDTAGDLQVKGETNSHLLFADASAERLGILESDPKTTLHIKDFGLDSETSSFASNLPQTIATFDAAEFTTAKMIVQVTNTETNEYQSEEILIVHDGVNVDFVEYAIVFTSADSLATFDAEIAGGVVELQAIAATQDPTTYKVVKTLITD